MNHERLTNPRTFATLKLGGLRDVKLVISDAHEGIKAAVSKVFTATWQRCPAEVS